MVVRIQSKVDLPYGVLSNGYSDPKSVNSYIGEEYNLTLYNEPYDVEFDQKWSDLEKSVINKAIQIGIDAKSAIDPEFEGILLSSETLPILYISEDSYVGVDFSTKVGENIYGKWLTNYRNILLEKSPAVFYNVYVLDRLCKTAINYESLEKYLLLAREGQGVRALINTLMEKYGKSVDIPPPEIVENLRQITKQQLSYKAEEIILNVIKQNIRNVRVANLNKFRNYIFSVFVSKVIKKYQLDYAPEKFIQEMDPIERNYSIDRVYEGYQKEQLNGYEIKSDIYVPSLEEVKALENLEYQGVTDKLPVTNYSALVDSRTSRLSLKDDRYVFFVGELSFPSIAHYIVYSLGTLIKDFNPYIMIYDSENKTYFRLDDSKRFLNENLKKFKVFYFNQRLVEGIRRRVNEKPYLQDFLMTLYGDTLLFPGDINPKLTSETYQNIIQQDLRYSPKIWGQRGKVIDFLDTDSFFVFVQKEMFESFLNIASVLLPFKNAVKVEDIKRIYELFFGNIPGTTTTVIHSPPPRQINYSNIKKMAQLLGYNFSDDSCKFLKTKFLERILTAEYLSQLKFNNGANRIFPIKFLIVESRYRIFLGEFIDPNRIYRTQSSRENLALARVLSFICAYTNNTIPTQELVDKAFYILTSSSSDQNVFLQPMIRKTPVNPEKDQEFSGGLPAIDETPLEVPVETEVGDIEEDENREISGYLDQEEEYDSLDDDLMMATEGNAKIMDADQLADYIYSTLKTPRNIAKYISEKVKDLSRSPRKNWYRINLYQ